MRSRKHIEAGATDFETDTLDAMARMQTALSKIITALPDRPERPFDLQKSLKLDSKLCWQVFNILRADNLVVAAQYVPRSAPLERLLAAAEGTGIERRLSIAVRQAASHFDTVVAEHGPDRTAFDLMVTATSDNADGAPLNLFHRRNAFRSESMLWGSKVGAYITTLILLPPNRSGQVEQATLTFRLRQRRLRPDAPIVVHAFPAVTKSSSLPTAPYRPIDPVAAAEYQAPLLPRFCSQPLPALKTIEKASGWSYIELAGNAMGERSATDFAFGRVEEHKPRGESNRVILRSNTLFRTSAEKMIVDLLIHRASAGPVRSEAQVYARPSGPEEWEQSEDLRPLPNFSESVLLGPADKSAQLDVFPRYTDALSYAGEQIGFDLADFDLYRFTLDYPILHSIVRHQLVRVNE